MKLTLGAQRLARYLETKGLSDDDFAAICEVGATRRRLHRTQIHAYRTGRTKPGIEHAVAIQLATRRAVRLAEWAKPVSGEATP